MDISNSVTRNDIERLEASLQQLLKATKKNKLEPAHLYLLDKIVEALNELRLVVEFDHEERLKALEEYLANR